MNTRIDKDFAKQVEKLSQVRTCWKPCISRWIQLAITTVVAVFANVCETVWSRAVALKIRIRFGKVTFGTAFSRIDVIHDVSLLFRFTELAGSFGRRNLSFEPSAF
jgi:hypothetical protein